MTSVDSASLERGQRSTIRDVARHAGVSVATVSRALRGSATVRPETRNRVETAAKELRFTPSSLGRSLAEQRHAANGIVFPDLSGPYYAELVLGYENVAASLGQSVLILSTEGRDNADGLVLELAGRVDGLMLFGHTVDDAVVSEIVSRGVPTVLVARPPVRGADTVSTDNVAGMRELAIHLLERGYSRATFVGDPKKSPDVADRWTGLLDAFSNAGKPSPFNIATDGFKEEDGTAAAQILLAERETLPDVVVCANDEIALGLSAGLQESGLLVPTDIAVTGWDDVMAARFAGLTTVRQPMRELGEHAAALLDARIRGSQDEPHHDVLPTRIVVRKTS